MKFRVNVGEKVRLYCREGFRKAANNPLVFMDAVEFLGKKNDEVIFRTALDKHDRNWAFFEQA